MPIDRTAFNAMIDDDGTGTVGTPWNKTQTKNVVLDPIDAALVKVNAPSTEMHYIGGPLTLAGGTVVLAANTVIRPDTVDGADTRLTQLAGGGDASQTRGAIINLWGNESGGLPGTLDLFTGNVAGSSIRLIRNDGLAAVAMDGMSGTLFVSYQLSLGGEVVSTSTNATWRHNTADGADTRITYLCGGGSASQARGGYLILGGNEASSPPGSIQLLTGTVAGSLIGLYRNDGNIGFWMDGATGQVTISNLVTLGGNVRLTASSGGLITRETNDGADTLALALCGGGSYDASRGGTVFVWGNESSFPGIVQLAAGNVVGAAITFTASNGSTVMSVSGATGAVTVANHLYFSTTGNAIIGRNTVAGSDAASVTLSASSAADQTRGACITVYGNQTGDPGSIAIVPGNQGSSSFRVWRGDGLVQNFSIAAANGGATFDSTLAQQVVFNTTNPQGGYTVWLYSSTVNGYVGSAAAVVSSATYLNSAFCIRAIGKLVLYSDAGAIVAPHVYSSTSGSAVNVNVDVAGDLRRSTSSRRYKRAIAPLRAAEGLATVLALRPVSSEHVQDGGVRRVGLIAEEVAAVDPRLAVLGPDGQPDEVAYTHLTAPLIAAIQDLHARLAALERTQAHGTV